MIENNNINSTVSVAELKIRPFDSSSKIACTKPGHELFDSRRDFLLFKRIRGVAVSLQVVNENVFLARPRGQNVQLSVWLVDADTGEAMTSKSVVVKFRSSDVFLEIRVDMPLEYNDVITDHRYEVMVCEGVDPDCVLARKQFRFYDMPRLKMLPTKWFKVSKAYIDAGSTFDSEAMRGIDNVNSASVGLRFNMECCMPVDRDRLPEVELRVTAPDGTVESEYCYPEWDEAGLCDNMVMVCSRYDVAVSPSGIYYAELRCMGYPFAGAVYSIGDTRLCGAWQDDQVDYIPKYSVEKGEARWSSLIAKENQELAGTDGAGEDDSDMDNNNCVCELPDIDDMTGLVSVKRKLAEYTQLVRFSRLRERSGLPALSTPLHAMFLGSPGTGKTTVAKIIGRRLHDIGALSSGHVVIRERSTLIGKYYNSESENTLKALDEAKGGILFIDEAYQLYQPEDPKDPGRFVIETLMTALADEANRDWMLILAGYSEPMRAMFALNPGLRSRIPSSNIYTFDDFTETELMEIAEGYFRRQQFKLASGARRALMELLSHDYRHRDSDFGNARHVINLIQTAILPAMAMRLSAIEHPSARQLSRIEAADIPAPQLRLAPNRTRIGFAV